MEDDLHEYRRRHRNAYLQRRNESNGNQDCKTPVDSQGKIMSGSSHEDNCSEGLSGLNCKQTVKNEFCEPVKHVKQEEEDREFAEKLQRDIMEAGERGEPRGDVDMDSSDVRAPDGSYQERLIETPNAFMQSEFDDAHLLYNIEKPCAPSPDKYMMGTRLTRRGASPNASSISQYLRNSPFDTDPSDEEKSRVSSRNAERTRHAKTDEDIAWKLQNAFNKELDSSSELFPKTPKTPKTPESTQEKWEEGASSGTRHRRNIGSRSGTTSASIDNSKEVKVDDLEAPLSSSPHASINSGNFNMDATCDTYGSSGVHSAIVADSTIPIISGDEEDDEAEWIQAAIAQSLIEM